MTIDFLADLRSRSDFLPFCPSCSHLGHMDTPDILIGPSLREFRGCFKFIWCCSLSETTQPFTTRYEAAVWWRNERLKDARDPAVTSKRRNTLKKLEAANLEAIVA